MQPDRTAVLTRLMRTRILIMDGAMGTMIQQHGLSEAEFRGADPAVCTATRTTFAATTTCWC